MRAPGRARRRAGRQRFGSADRRRFHPIREFLDGLPEWDGVPRVETLLVDLLGADFTMLAE